MLTIPQPVYEALRAHGVHAYPHECCGVLLGTRREAHWQIAAAIPTANAETATPHNRYRIAPADLARILRRALLDGLEIAGFYHSHPDHPAHWSQTDLAEAHWLDCAYLITAIRHGQPAETNAFLLAGSGEEDKHFLPIPIQIEPESSF